MYKLVKVYFSVSILKVYFLYVQYKCTFNATKHLFFHKHDYPGLWTKHG